MATGSPDRFPKIIRHLALNGAMGMAVGASLAGGLVLTDTAGLGGLFAGTDTPIAAAVLFGGMFALTFGSLAMGSSIMLLPSDDTFPKE